MNGSGWNLQKTVLALAFVGAAWMGFRHAFHETPLVQCGPFPDPTQVALDSPEELAAPSGYRIEALDQYSVEALVVSVKRYSRGREADISPLDLALAWGPLTSQAALDTVRYSHASRWYHFEWSYANPPPVSQAEIASHSANTHIILPPGREDLRDFASSVRRGDVVRLNGYLVRASAPGQWHWTSSRTRGDTGGHSCELLYLTSASISPASP